MAKRQPAPVIDVHSLPVILLIDDVAAVYRISTKTIRRQLYMGTFRPLPYKKLPYRWRRADVIAEITAPSSRLAPSGKQGFATTKARRQAAEREPVAVE